MRKLLACIALAFFCLQRCGASGSTERSSSRARGLEELAAHDLAHKTDKCLARHFFGVRSLPSMEGATHFELDQEGYDYIIVGGGTAGCPLAATLSQKFKVLLMERGGSPYGNPAVMQEAGFGILRTNNTPGSPFEMFVSTDGVPNGRGRILGGGSSVNAGFYSRAEHSFIDLLGLDKCLVEDSYCWVEAVVASIAQLENRPYQSMFRASLLQAGVTPDNGATYEHLIGTKTGASIFDENGTRRPASNLLAYANAKNIQVMLHATASKVIFQGRTAHGVEYIDSSGRLRTAWLKDNGRGEVILSAGALGSPQLLMLSGIGPGKDLQALGIQVLVNSPEVGKQMADNPATYTPVPSPSFVESSRTRVVGITSFGSYVESGTRVAVVPGFGRPAGVIVQKANGPLSKGELHLNTTDVTVTPIVTFNYFKVPRDLKVCAGGVDVVEKVILSDAYKPFRFENQSLPSGGTVAAPNRNNSTYSAQSIRTALEAYCKNNVATIYHFHGGCLRGIVVDSRYKVRGVQGLRVLDGSTFETSPGTNPQATLMMLGRYLGVTMIKERIGISVSGCS